VIAAGIVIALQLAASAARTTIAYERVPPEVTRVELYAWTGERVGRREDVSYGSRRFIVHGDPRASYVVVFSRTDGRYLIDGPFAWPDSETTREVSIRWHRTIDGMLPPESDAGARVQLIRADIAPAAWPVCFATEGKRWTCWGVADDERAIVLVYAGGAMWWTSMGSSAPQGLRAARWGRILAISNAVSEAAPVRVTLAYPVAPPPGRMRAIRLGTTAVPDARVIPVSPTAFWIAGHVVPPNAWVEVTSDAAAPVYLSLADVVEGPAAMPLRVDLRERRVVDGRVTGAGGEAAAGTLVTVFRLIDPPTAEANRVPPRRVIAIEAIADPEGRFALTQLGDANYELLAWHPQFGRASLVVPSIAQDLVVRLQTSGIVRGRVVAGGRPVEGIDVISVPDAAAFSAAEDMTDVKGGDTRTGPDGRFSVAIAASGGGELRIGGGRYPVKRIALPRAPVPLFDAGDIDLGRAIRVTIVLDRDPGCDVRATGPVGRTGLQFVFGSRAPSGVFDVEIPEPGFWEFTLRCEQQSRSLSPAVVQIGPSDSGKEVRMIVR
jgi:hypothetical protein